MTVTAAGMQRGTNLGHHTLLIENQFEPVCAFAHNTWELKSCAIEKEYLLFIFIYSLDNLLKLVDTKDISCYMLFKVFVFKNISK